MQTVDLAALDGGTSVSQWPPPPRAPLPPFPQQSLPYATDLWFTPPDKPSRDFWRGNAWCVTIPGLPAISGGPRDSNRLITYLLQRYPRDWWGRILDAYWTQRGYTHFTLSWPDARSADGMSLSAFLEMCAFVKQVVPYVHVFLGSKVYDDWYMTADQFRDRTRSDLLAMLNAGVVDVVSPTWEHNIWNTPGEPTHEIFGQTGQVCAGFNVPVYCHFAIHYTSWQSDDGSEDRWGFWRRHNPANASQPNYAGPMRGLLYQGDSAWGFNEYQGRIADTTDRPETIPTGWGSAFNFVSWEGFATSQFNTNDHPDENDGDLAGYVTAVTPGRISVAGGGNGQRLPSGSVF